MHMLRRGMKPSSIHNSISASAMAICSFLLRRKSKDGKVEIERKVKIRAIIMYMTLAAAGLALSVCTGSSSVRVNAEKRPSLNQQNGVRRALLIGISKYDNENFPRLPYPANDIARMKELLESPRYGFKVTVLSDDGGEKPDREHILAAIQKTLIDDAQPGDFCLFYFSGHG